MRGISSIAIERLTIDISLIHAMVMIITTDNHCIVSREINKVMLVDTFDDTISKLSDAQLNCMTVSQMRRMIFARRAMLLALDPSQAPRS